LFKRRKPAPRLFGFDYKGQYAYFVACATYKKEHYFVDYKVVDLVLSILKDCSIHYGFGIYVYCFMPDHLHMLLTAEEKASLLNFMRQFKQSSSYTFKKMNGNPLWRRSYYDSVLRSNEMLDDVAWYIINNPVRKGLTDDYRNYTFLGSFLFDVRELSGRT